MLVGSVILRAVSVFCLSLLLITHSPAESSPYDEQLWRVSEGLPNTQVRALAQATNGLLWVGTLEGLASFDGLTFTTIESPFIQEMSGQHFIGLATSPDGSVWFSNGKGISRHLDGKTVQYGLTNGLPSLYVLTIFCTRAGDIVVGTEKGARKWSQGRFVPLAEEDVIGPAAVRAVLEDRRGNLWLGCTNGLFKFEQGRLSRTALHRSSVRANSVLALAEGLDGSIWAGTSDGLTRLDGNTITNYAVAEGLLTNSVRALCQAKDGTLWVGSPAGLQRLEKGQLPFITQFNMFATEYDWTRESIFALFEDSEQNIWAGSNHGLMRYRRHRFDVYSAREGSPSRVINTVVEDGMGRVWLGTAAGLARVDNRRIIRGVPSTNKVEAAELSSKPVLSASADAHGGVWLGTRIGAYHLSSSGLDHYTEENGGLPGNDVRVVHYSFGTKTCWLGTSNGLARFESNKFVPMLLPGGLAFSNVRAIVESTNHQLWVASEQGLFSFTNGIFQKHSGTNSVSLNRVCSLYADDSATLWIAPETGGLARLRDDVLTFFGSNACPLLGERITSIIEDDHGNLWMGCRRGIFRAAIANLSGFAEGATNAVRCVAYGKEDGLRSVQSRGNTSQPAACKTSDGRLWFATVDGVAVIDSRKLNSNPNPPKVFVRSIQVDGQPVRVTNRMKLPPGHGNVQFEYSGICLQSPEKVQFQYRLEGVDPDWIDAGSRRVASYAHLRPGRYRFLLRAGNGDEVWSPAASDYAFSLTPHFYQRSSFYAACIGLVVLGFVTIHLLRVRRHESQQRRLEGLVATRTEHLETAIKSMETFTYSMAHDLRGPLRSIQSLVSLWIEEYGERFDPAAHDYARRIQGSVDKMDALMRDLLVYGLVAHATAAVEKVQVKEVFEAVRADLQPELEARQAEIQTSLENDGVIADPVLLRQVLTNLLTNSVKFVPPQTVPRVALHTERSDDFLRICITDNGIGIEPEYQERIFGLFERLDTDKKYPGTGVGLAIVQKAVERMGGKVGVDSAPGHGSCFWVELPAAQAA